MKYIDVGDSDEYYISRVDVFRIVCVDASEMKSPCEKCDIPLGISCEAFACKSWNREDGKNVVFQRV